MIPTLHLHDLGFSGESPSRSQREERSLGPRVAEPHLFDRRHSLHQGLREPNLQLVRGAVDRALRALREQRLVHARMGVTMQQRSEVVQKIEVLVPVGIPDSTTLTALNE